MTSEEHSELLACSKRIAELLYQEACEQERPLTTLGDIEVTVREQIQTYVSPSIGAFLPNRQRH